MDDAESECGLDSSVEFDWIITNEADAPSLDEQLQPILTLAKEAARSADLWSIMLLMNNPDGQVTDLLMFVSMLMRKKVFKCFLIFTVQPLPDSWGYYTVQANTDKPLNPVIEIKLQTTKKKKNKVSV